MYRAMRLRCLLHPPLLCKINSLVGRFSAPGGSALVQRLGAPPRPSSEGRRLCRFYCSKGGVGNAEAAVRSGGGCGGSGSISSEQEHARLGERDQQEWLSGEQFLTGCKRRDSPFLTKRERFRNEFLRRVVPWEKGSLSWRNFPYYVDENARQLLSECVSSHLRHKDVALEYGSRLQSSGGRILLQSLPGTELYRERLVRALTHELRVPLLVLDRSVLSPSSVAAAQHLESLLPRLATLSHYKQFHARLLTSGHLHSLPGLRGRFLDRLALSVHPAALPHALHLLRSLPSPTTNDLNAALRGLAASPHPSRSVLLLAGRLLPAPSPPPPRLDALSLSFALKASARCSDAPATLQLHVLLLRLGFAADVRLITTLLDSYAKCGDLASAWKAFDEMTVRDVATWNALLAGLAQGTEPNLALALFRRLAGSFLELPPREEPNDVTIVAALSACAQLGSLQDGLYVHEFSRKLGVDGNVRACNALIDMYSKCGSLDRALQVFHSIKPEGRTLVSYNAAIQALSMHGYGADALRLFDEMPTCIEPDEVTYLAVLCGCNHAGLVDDGLRVFHAMRVSPNVKHYGTVVDLLGRAGRLAEAYDTINAMPFPADIVLWQTLLGASKMHGDVELAELAATKLAKLGSNVDGDYVLLSNVYASKARWADVGRVRDTMRSNDVRKVPGFSYTEIDGVMHKFINGDKEHPRWQEIYRALEDIGARISELGYEPETSNVLHDIGEEEKQYALCYHSEKLAIAFGLIATPPGETIRVIKNLRTCGDCHVVAKLISKAYGRVIVIRDRTRFHHFKDGQCSCRDYW